MWKSFVGVVRFILTKYDLISSHGDPVRAKSYLFFAHLGCKSCTLDASLVPGCKACPGIWIWKHFVLWKSHVRYLTLGILRCGGGLWRLEAWIMEAGGLDYGG